MKRLRASIARRTVRNYYYSARAYHSFRDTDRRMGRNLPGVKNRREHLPNLENWSMIGVKRTPSFLILICVSLGISCSLYKTSRQNSGPRVGAKAQQFLITESAYFFDPAPYDPNKPDQVYIQWAAVISNPNSDFFGTFPTIHITARDEHGDSVGRKYQILHQLPPGQTIAFSGQFTAVRRPVEVEIAPDRVQWSPVETVPSDYVPFEAQKIALKSTGLYGYVITGEILNPYKKDAGQLSVTALFRDDDGKLLGGGQTFVMSVPANEPRPFRIEAFTVPENVTKVEVVASPWGNTNWQELAVSR